MEICDEGMFGMHPEITEWKVRLGLQLSSAYAAFRAYCKANRVTCSQPRFTVSRLSLTTLQCYPMLKCKAWNSMVVISWLASICAEAGEDKDMYSTHRAAMLWGFARFHDLLRDGVWMDDNQVHELCDARDAMLGCYHMLSKLASERNAYRYPMKPKHHMLDHAVRRALHTKLNPGSHWAFAEEDNVGIVMKICQACHDMTMGSRSLQRWCMHFFWDLQSCR